MKLPSGNHNTRSGVTVDLGVAEGTAQLGTYTLCLYLSIK